MKLFQATCPAAKLTGPKTENENSVAVTIWASVTSSFKIVNVSVFLIKETKWMHHICFHWLDQLLQTFHFPNKKFIWPRQVVQQLMLSLLSNLKGHPPYRVVLSPLELLFSPCLLQWKWRSQGKEIRKILWSGWIVCLPLGAFPVWEKWDNSLPQLYCVFWLLLRVNFPPSSAPFLLCMYESCSCAFCLSSPQ